MKIDKLKYNGDNGIIATYAIDDFSEESAIKVEKCLADKLLKLENEGWVGNGIAWNCTKT